MIPLVRKFFHDLAYSPERVTLWFRSGWFIFWQALGALSVQGSLPFPPKWQPWVTTLAFVLSGAGLAAKAGDKNSTVP